MQDNVFHMLFALSPEALHCMPHKPYDARLQIVDDLGWGVTSRVYRVRDAADKALALKICTMPGMDAWKEFEVLQALKAKKVSHICRAEGISDDGTQLLLSPVGVPVFTPIITQKHALQFVDTVRHIHICGYLHHDIRPENVLFVTKTWNVKPQGSRVLVLLLLYIS